MLFRLISSLFVLLLLITPGLAEPISIVINPLAPVESPKILATEYLKKLIMERSDGRIELTINNNSQLSTQQILDALNTKQFQLALLDVRDIDIMFPMLEIYDLPFMFKDRRHLHRVIDNEIGRSISRVAPDQKMQILSIWDGASRQILAEQSISTFEGDLPLFFTASRAVRSANDGDWVECTLTDTDKLSRRTTLDTLTLTNHSFSTAALLTHQRFWTQLPEDLKIIIIGAIEDASLYIRELAEQADKETLQHLEKDGKIDIATLPQKERTLWRKKALTFFQNTRSQQKSHIIDTIMKN
ncbi:MAG TPA: TRAP transporter substrate-binding protein DctP [Geopsychrobacteraceae bacterium]|nr:TRAP transporter substrate-binding protein DctP [Geopsychrobacteraceae bacterium]